MRKPSLVVALAFASLFAVPLGCAPTTVVVQEAPHSRVAVPFLGVYAKVAQGTFQNGRRIRVANAAGAATVRVEAGRVTFDQTYVWHGDLKRVVQTYSFGARDVRPLPGGDFELVLTFRTMSGDTQGYNADRIAPRLEAHRLPSGWQVDLFTTDNNGVVGVAECQ
jgi:hypothetical protein